MNGELGKNEAKVEDIPASAPPPDVSKPQIKEPSGQSNLVKFNFLFLDSISNTLTIEF